MTPKRSLAACVGCWITLAVAAAWADGDGPWSLAFADTFDGGTPLAADVAGLPAAPWVPLRGDWLITPAGRLRIQRTWPSDSAILLDLPLRGVDLRVTLDVHVGEPDRVTVQLQSGEVAWGGGGIADIASVTVSGGEHGPGPHAVTLELSGGAFRATIDGKPAPGGSVPIGRSLVNCRLAVGAIPCGELDNLRIETRPGSTSWLGLPATPEANRAATVEAAAWLDPALPDCGFQQAIEALPPGGGVVILPAGHFRLRRHLRLRSFVTLRGQGAGKTILEHVPTAASPILAVQPEPPRVTLADASPFSIGDAVCFGSAWGHPGSVGVGDTGNRGVLVLARDANVLTLSEMPPPKAAVLTHVFPLVYAREAEFLEVKDLTLLGPAANDGQASGRFMNNLLTFGVVAAARVTRVDARRYPADGFSFQGGADLMVTGNTIRETQQALHPGTTTRRFLSAGNLCRDNRLGLFFCWYNTHGIYLHNSLDGIAGFADAGDFLNLLAFNDDTSPHGLQLTTGAASVLYGNRLAGPLRFSGMGQPPGKLRHLYEAAPRLFVIAANRAEQLVAEPRKLADGTRPLANVLADNAWRQPPSWGDVDPQAQLCLEGQPALPPGVDPGCGRADPLPPPALPEPVLDGRAFYDPAAPDQGFGKALAELAARGGGSLLLPGGRYLLQAPLSVPDNVTLSGQGLATVLIDGTPGDRAAIEVADAAQVTVRDLTLEALSWNSADRRRQPPLLTAREVDGLTLIALDLRGPFQAAGLRLEQCQRVLVEECRAFENEGFHLVACRRVTLRTNLASRHGKYGFYLERLEGECLVTGNFAWTASPAEASFRVTRCESGWLAANLAQVESPGATGLAIDASGAWTLAGNLVVNAPRGIRIDSDNRPCRVLYNLVTDSRVLPAVATPIDDPKAASELRGNLLTGLHGSFPAEGTPSAAHNLLESPQPSGTSLQEWPGK